MAYMHSWLAKDSIVDEKKKARTLMGNNGKKKA
jgi:hypothetical protein